MKYNPLIILLLLLAGCGTYYKEPPTSSPHALLDIKGSNLEGVWISPMEFNNLPRSEYDINTNDYRLPPGEMNMYILVSKGSKIIGEYILTLDVRSEEHYKFKVEETPELFIVSVLDKNGEVVVTNEAKKRYRDGGSDLYIPIVLP